MPLKEYKNMWVLRKKKFFLIVLCAHTLIIVLLFGIFAHLNLYIKSKKYKNGHLDNYTTTLLVIMLNSYKNQVKRQWK